MAAASSRFHSIGQRYHQFKLVNITDIPELQCVLHELIHEPTGAQVMHIQNDDPENLFCLSFQTRPSSSNGVAHILEHTVLCGSKKYPIKDPFFSMNRRSLNTFMNALTGADFTCYPAASQVPQDFYNLLEVYLDAVFHPTLNRYSFLQEGCRLEFSTPDDTTTPLEYKGIVYNEMKGSLSSVTARLSEVLHESLFPNVTYGYNSGGDPHCIPQLTYEELKEFHDIFYHPSRCLFFFYGNMPLEHHLDFILEHTLQHTNQVSPLPPIPLQPRFKKPVYREETYPIPPTENLKDKSLIAFAWLTCHILQQQDVLALIILEVMLMDTDASPLKKALLQSGLCKQATSFIDVELNEVPCGLILKGCEAEHADILENIIQETLNELFEKGFPLQLIENAIHQLECHRSEITGDHAPFGLSLFMRSGLIKQHGADPTEGLKIHSLFDRLREAILINPRYFNDIIKQYFLDNPHRVRVVMRPDEKMGEKETLKEKKLLEEIKSSLSDKQKEELVKQASALETFQHQQEEEDIECLPKIELKDIPLSAKNYPLSQEKVGVLDVFHHNVFTNNLVYADLIFNLPKLHEKDLAYLRLLTVVLTQVGCGGRSYEENLEYIQAHTGGIGAGISLNLQAHQHSLCHPTFHLRGKALHRKVPKLFALLQETVTSAKIDDVGRLKEILLKHFTAIESQINQSALKYAINLSASGLNVPSKIANSLYGLDYYWSLREIVKNFDQQGDILLEKLADIQEQVTCLEHPHLVLSCQSGIYNQIHTHRFYGLAEMSTHPFQPWKQDLPLDLLVPQGRVIASSVAFIGQVFPTVSYTHSDAPALNIAAFLFDNLTLHRKIREQGGAYGGGAVSNPLSGNFYFYSYRDPNIVSTLEAFQEAVETVIRGEFDQLDLEEAKFEMIQGLDSPMAPGSRGEVAYGWWKEGRTLDIRQAFRNRLLSLTKEEVIDAVQRVIPKQMAKGVPVVFAGKDLLEKANQQLKAEGKPLLRIEGI